MSIEGQGHFFTIYFPGFVCFVLYSAKISGERLQDHWSSGFMKILYAETVSDKPWMGTTNRNLNLVRKCTPYVDAINRYIFNCKGDNFWV